MNRYELQSDMQDSSPEKSVPRPVPAPGSEVHAKSHALPPAIQREPRDENEPVLQTLALLQRQQGEQIRLLRQLLHEIELLKSTQTAQHTTVTKLDRRMRRARFFRISWVILRTAVFVAGIAFIIYIIGIDQIQAMWERLVWLFS